MMRRVSFPERGAYKSPVTVPTILPMTTPTMNKPLLLFFDMILPVTYNNHFRQNSLYDHDFLVFFRIYSSRKIS